MKRFSQSCGLEEPFAALGGGGKGECCSLGTKSLFGVRLTSRV